MKVNVVTVLNTHNYGTMLQTIATKSLLEGFGMQVEFLDFCRKDQTTEAIFKRRMEMSKNNSGFKKCILKCIIRIEEKKKHKVFRKFIENNVALTKRMYHSYEEVLSQIPQADVYCTGSDQMWNSGWNQGIEKTFFLDYVPDGKVRISFSTSIGKTDWEDNEREQVLPMLQRYDLITVREESARQLLDKCGIAAQTVLDPTLMVDRLFWKSIVDKRTHKKPYLLVYKLHEQHGKVDFDKYVRKLAQEKNLDIISIQYNLSPCLKNPKETVFLPTVEKFLTLMYYADYIITDSFHGTAFSINFNKQFSVIYPEQYSTRIENILQLTGLTNRHIDENTIEKRLDEINFDQANKILDREREKSTKPFLDFFKVDINKTV